MKKTLLTLLLGLLAVTGYSQARFDIHGGIQWQTSLTVRLI